MARLVLVVSGVLEAVWATALGGSEGFTGGGAHGVFAGGIVLSMAGLAYSSRTLPTGTAYAVWVGIGATLTVVYAMVTGQESFTVLKTLFLTLIIGGFIWGEGGPLSATRTARLAGWGADPESG